MRSRHVPMPFIAFALAVLLIGGIPGAATASSTPLTSVSVLLLVPQDPAGTGYIVSGTLPSTSPLPATVTLALPAGLQVQWAGEILGGDPSADPTAKYTTRRQGAWDVADLTITKARIGQIEAAYPAAVTVAGGITTAKLEWTAPEAVKSVALSIRIPSGATVQSVTGGLVVGPASASEVPYDATVSNVKAGQTLTATLVYKAAAGSAAASSTAPAGTAAPTAPAAGTTSGPTSGSTSQPLLIVLVLAFLISWTLYALMEVRRRETASLAAHSEKAEEANRRVSSKTTVARPSAAKAATKATGKKDS